MTVNEFIKYIKDNNIDGNTRIVIDGYEGGISNIKNIKETKIQLNYHYKNQDNYSIYGQHELIEKITYIEKEDIVNCLYISRFEEEEEINVEMDN